MWDDSNSVAQTMMGTSNPASSFHMTSAQRSEDRYVLSVSHGSDQNLPCSTCTCLSSSHCELLAVSQGPHFVSHYFPQLSTLTGT